MTLRYLILSPSDEVRRRLLTELFGAALELNPRGDGERVTIRMDDNQLEILGLGQRSRLLDLVNRLIKGGIHPEAVLILVPSGDEDTWQEARDVISALERETPAVPVRTWVFGQPDDITFEKAKRELIALLDEQVKGLS